jgi:hypothetical protein
MPHDCPVRGGLHLSRGGAYSGYRDALNVCPNTAVSRMFWMREAGQSKVHASFTDIDVDR